MRRDSRWRDVRGENGLDEVVLAHSGGLDGLRLKQRKWMEGGRWAKKNNKERCVSREPRQKTGRVARRRERKELTSRSEGRKARTEVEEGRRTGLDEEKIGRRRTLHYLVRILTVSP